MNVKQIQTLSVVELEVEVEVKVLVPLSALAVENLE